MVSADKMIQQFFRSTSLTHRITEHIGPFLAAYHADSNDPWLNYAIPDDEADPTDADVQRLIEWYRRRDRAPRFEYLPGRSPAVRSVLERNGFVVEAEMPLMVCSRNDLAPVLDPLGIEFIVVTEMDDVVEALMVQYEAFGDPPPDVATINRRYRTVHEDLILLLARNTETGESAGAAMTLSPCNGVTEVAGIAVRESFRKRGIAAALTYRVSTLALSQGVHMLFLSPASDEGERIYGRVGFRSVSGILHMSLPAKETSR